MRQVQQELLLSPWSNRLQKVQNQAARIVTLTKKRDHISPVLESLHWLPVEERINFKVLCHAYNVKHDHAPEYLCNILKPYVPQRSLRSSDKNNFIVPRSNLLLGERAFSVYAAKKWNMLDGQLKSLTSIESFKRHLKTHLFKMAFS